MAPHIILVASYTNSVRALSFDPSASAPTLRLTSDVEVGSRPSWLAGGLRGPTGTIVFADLEQENGTVVILRYDADGKGVVVGSVGSGGGYPCSMEVSPSGTALFVGNYIGGSIASFAITPEVPHLSPTPSAPLVVVEGSGPHARQQSSHPHQIYFHGEELLVPDLGADKMWRLVKNEDGNWAVQSVVEYPAGTGPRHVVVHDGVLYTVLELTSQLSAHRLPPLPGVPTHLTTVSTLSTPTVPGMLAAEILLAPSSKPGGPTYLYVGNRDEGHPDGDAISIFTIEDGTPVLTNEVRTGLTHPRGMIFGGEDNQWLVVGGKDGGGVKVFERINGGDDLREVAHAADVDESTGFLWLA